DIIPAGQRGTASGVMGLAYMLGTIVGSLVGVIFHFNSQQLLAGTQSFADYWANIVQAYGLVAAVCLIMALITVFAVREIPWRPEQRTPTANAQPGSRLDARFWRDLGLTLVATVVIVGGALALLRVGLFGLRLDTNALSVVELAAIAVGGVGAAYAFGFRPARNPDFSWVVLTRMLVMMGVYIVQNFLLYYMQDVAHAPSPQGATTIFLLLLTLTATISTFFAGYTSDRIGRKRMVYISGGFMTVVGLAFILAPYLIPTGVLTIAYIAAAIFGVGFGAYVAVDWALVADTLPSDATYARDMGVWNIALTLPQVFAVVFGGWLLTLGVLLGQRTLGYTLLFVWFVVFCALGTVTVRYIRGIKN
ncbi:MAG TPA: MFS transporter, partial [Ktedonobacterales bacterium]|nr:MFS transporter [Ktedonobacterales bacterium]